MTTISSIKNSLWAKALSLVVIIQFLCLDLSWAGINKEYLAARSRIQLFFSKNNIELSTPQEMALSMAMGQLQKIVLEEGKSNITEEIRQLNNTLSTANITITTSNLEFDQESKIPYIAITVTGNKNSFRVYFLKEDERKVNTRLMIEEKDLWHFKYPRLEGVWFVDTNKMLSSLYGPSEGERFWKFKRVSTDRIQRIQKAVEELEDLLEQRGKHLLQKEALIRQADQYLVTRYQEGKIGLMFADLDKVWKEGLSPVERARSLMRVFWRRLSILYNEADIPFWEQYFIIDSRIKDKYREIGVLEGYKLPPDYGIRINEAISTFTPPGGLDVVTLARLIECGGPECYTALCSDYLEEVMSECLEERLPSTHFFVKVVDIFSFRIPDEDSVKELLDSFGIKIPPLIETGEVVDRKMKLFELLKPLLLSAGDMPPDIRARFFYIVEYYIVDNKDVSLAYYYLHNLEDVSAEEFTERMHRHICSLKQTPGAFMVGEEKLVLAEHRHSFLGEVKDVIRNAFRITGKVLTYYWDGNRLVGETNRGEERWVGFGTRHPIGGRRPTQFVDMCEIRVDGYIQKLLITILRNHPYLHLAFIEGLNLLSFKSLDLYQVARASEKRNQIYLPMNLLYLLQLSPHAEWVMEYIVTYEVIRKESSENLHASVEVIRQKTRERLGAGAIGKEKAFLETVQLSTGIEYISREIEKHNGEDLILSLDEDGVLRGRRTGRIEAILEIDIKQKFGVRLGDQTLTYWDILLERLIGDKDSKEEIITKGESKDGISKVLIQTLLRRELIKREQAKSQDGKMYGPLSDINLTKLAEFAQVNKDSKKTISIGSTCLINIEEVKDSKYTYVQNATGIQYILKAIKDGYNVEVVNEQRKLIEKGPMGLLLKQIFGTPLQVVEQTAYEDREKNDELLLLSEDSTELRRERKDVTTIVSSKGTSFSVLLTFGLYKLAKSEDSEIKKMLMALGYTDEQADEIIKSSGIIILPPIASFAHIINTIAEFTRTIDVAA